MKIRFLPSPKIIAQASSWALEDVKFRGAVNHLPETSNGAGEQAEKLPEFSIVLQKISPNETDFCPT